MYIKIFCRYSFFSFLVGLRIYQHSCRNNGGVHKTWTEGSTILLRRSSRSGKSDEENLMWTHDPLTVLPWPNISDEGLCRIFMKFSIGIFTETCLRNTIFVKISAVTVVRLWRRKQNKIKQNFAPISYILLPICNSVNVMSTAVYRLIWVSRNLARWQP
jgi:hypothetical protein